MATPMPSGDLIAAVKRRSAADVAALLDDGADPNERDPISTLTALMIAAGMGSMEVATLLISAGADVHTLDSRAGASALHKACQGGHLEVAEALVEGGAPIDLETTTTGHTPLVEAIWFASDRIVEYLLGQDALVELKTYYGFSIDDHINYALRVNQGTNRPALERIQQLVAQRRARDALGVAGSLNKAVLANDQDGVHTAIAAGADLEERYPMVCSFSDGHTPLLLAARDGREQIVNMLVAAGADVNAVEPVFGAVPLHKATYHGYLEIARTLANAKGVDLNYQGPSNGYAPLHDSLWHGYADCAGVLLAAGARTDLVAYDGKLPVDIAIEQFGKDNPIVGELKQRALPRQD
jgi:uncharacterized protein